MGTGELIGCVHVMDIQPLHLVLKSNVMKFSLASSTLNKSKALHVLNHPTISSMT